MHGRFLLSTAKGWFVIKEDSCCSFFKPVKKYLIRLQRANFVKRKKACYKLVFFLLLLILFSSFVHAQPSLDPNRLFFETVSGDYGSIYNVIQDKEGFLWLAGLNGTIKYDGYKAETIYSGETVSALYQDSQGLIWMVVGSGIAVYDKETASTTEFFPEENNENALSGYSRVAYQKTQLITEDKQGNIWIATINGLNMFDKKSERFTAYKNKNSDPGSILDNDVWSVLTARDGMLWVGTATGLHRFDPKTGLVIERYPANSENTSALHGKYVQAIAEDDQGIIWAGTTEGGLNRLEPETKIFTHYQANSQKPHRIANNFIYRLAWFNELPNLIWIATIDGLSVLNKLDNSVTNYHYAPEKAEKGGLGAKIVHTIIQDNSGIIWLVVNEHGFLQKVDPGGRQFQSVLRDKNPEEGFVDITAPLRLGPDGNIWVNEVTSGIARVETKNGKIINHFRHSPDKPDGFPVHPEDFDFEPGEKDIVWVVTKGAIVKFNWHTEKIVSSYPSGTQAKIWPVWTDKHNPHLLYGNVWGKGLLKFNKKNGQTHIFTHDPKNPKTTLTGHTTFPLLPAYFQSKENLIWFSNPGMGFDLFDLDSGKVIRKHLFNHSDFSSKEFEAHAAYIQSNGRFWFGQNLYEQSTGKFTSFKDIFGQHFPSSSVCSITEDKQGMLWFAGFLDGTLTRIDPNTGKDRVFTERDGISPGLGSAFPPVVMPDGQVWMAGTGGITFFYPEKIIENPFHAPVFITSLTQGTRPLKPGIAPERVKEISLTWAGNYFEFEMAALSYRRPEENKYRYILEGIDKEWYYSGRKRNGRYSGLPPGTYILRIQGSNNDGVWSNHEARLRVNVTPPWWGTGWFRGFVFFTILTASLLGYTLRIKSIKQHSLELEIQVAERTRELMEEKEIAEKAKNSAELANRAKSIFLANMSHELRTPLNAVLGFSQLMKKSPDTTKAQKENLEIITRSGEHLLRLINNVLDISKIESGRVDLEFSDCDLHQLLEEMKSLMHVQAHEKNIAFILEQPENLPRHIIADCSKLRQVLINLISNAIKYTPHGNVILRASIQAQESPAHVTVRFEVEDTGPGIAEKDQKRIFQPFVQLENRLAAGSGTGLGLAICRQFVKLMGGEIGVSGEVGKGALFFFQIPVEVLPERRMPPSSVHAQIHGLAEGQPVYRLLIAEDQAENRLLLKKLLDFPGIELKEAHDGQEAINIFEQWRPDLIWMDIRMPGIDGFEAISRIRSMKGGKRVKIVAVTAHALEAERGKIMATGCDGFIRKPYKEAEIFDALSRYLGVRFNFEKEIHATAEKAGPTIPEDLPDEIKKELEQALIRIDNDKIKQVIEKISRHYPASAKKLGKMAQDLQYGQILRLIKKTNGQNGPGEKA